MSSEIPFINQSETTSEGTTPENHIPYSPETSNSSAPSVEQQTPNSESKRVAYSPIELPVFSDGSTPSSVTKVDRTYLLGDFVEYPLDESNHLRIPEDMKQEIEDDIDSFSNKKRFALPSLFSGTRTAGDYAIQVGNFSTKTAIDTLSNGKQVFIVTAPWSSDIHRMLDRISKRKAGNPFGKVSRHDWKKTFEEKSRIPVLPTDNPHSVAMPFIPNVNAYDAIANTQEIKNFGIHDWANHLDYDKKVSVACTIVDELSDIHQSKKGWGEVLLVNTILPSEDRAIIVDPEIVFEPDVSSEEQRAYDLHELLLSTAGAFKKGEGITDFTELVRIMINRYQGDSEVIEALQRISSQKRGLLQNTFRSFYDTTRIGISAEDMVKVENSITSL